MSFDVKRKTSPSVRSIVQSPEGYLWLATSEGLTRFDGARMTVIDRQSSPSLPSPNVAAILLDRSGHLWLGLKRDGVVRLSDGAVEHWTRSRGLPGTAISAIAEDGNGSLWVCTDQGPARLRTANSSEFEPVALPGSGPCSTLAVDERAGEVIVLRTEEPDGTWHESRLWIVDDEGYAWLHGDRGSRWMRNLDARPVVEVTRSGETARYRATQVPGPHPRIHERLRNEGRSARLVLQVHDELLIEVPEVETSAVRDLVREEMVGAYPLDPALAVEIGVGDTWADAKD